MKPNCVGICPSWSNYSTQTKTTMAVLASILAISTLFAVLAGLGVISQAALYATAPAAALSLVALCLCAYYGNNGPKTVQGDDKACDLSFETLNDSAKFPSTSWPSSRHEISSPSFFFVESATSSVATNPIQTLLGAYNAWQCGLSKLQMQIGEKEVNVITQSNDITRPAQELYVRFSKFRDHHNNGGTPVKSVSLNALASSLSVSENDLQNLFTAFRFPRISWTDLGCLNAFFVALTQIRGNSLGGNFLTDLNPAYSYSNGHPLWPESKIPEKGNLTKKELAQFLCVPVDQITEIAYDTGFQEIYYMRDNGVLGERTTRAFCKDGDVWEKLQNYYHNSGNPPPRIWELHLGEFGTKWTQREQLKLTVKS